MPLHSELVARLREWLKSVMPNEKLFPRLERKKTWLMVKKDLERAGIPYETDEGIADFHAAGRHTLITELVRSGAPLPVVQRQARHSDIKMTMRYTHVGIHDQAKALAALPVPQSSANPPSESAASAALGEQRALHRRCISRGFEGLDMSAAGSEKSPQKSENPRRSGGSDALRHPVAQDGAVEAAGIEPAGRNPQASIGSGHRLRDPNLGSARAARPRLILSLSDAA